MNRRIMKKSALICTLALGLAAPALQAETLLIKGGKVHTLADAGTLESADILVRDGRVESVAPTLNVSADKVIDASGKVVTPGVIAPDTQLGITEIGAAAATNDDAAVEGENTRGADRHRLRSASGL
ncbi:hypothetical protein [Microbulbifer taiwanensis]|uniref:hypothetical protein n=1 Tax=Microbulbifer taiwanensis TaxID=986746 RepID=UPI00360AC857